MGREGWSQREVTEREHESQRTSTVREMQKEVETKLEENKKKRGQHGCREKRERRKKEGK